MPTIDVRDEPSNETHYKFNDAFDYLYVKNGCLWIHSDMADEEIVLCAMSELDDFLKACNLAYIDNPLPVPSGGIMRSTRSA